MTTLFKLSFRTALKTACAAFLFCAATVFVAAGQTFTSLVDFDGTNGGVPQYGSLIQGTDRNLYGVASLGGNLKLCNHYGCGTVFKMSPEGKLTTLHNFDFKDGWLAYGKLVQTTRPYPCQIEWEILSHAEKDTGWTQPPTSEKSEAAEFNHS